MITGKDTTREESFRTITYLGHEKFKDMQNDNGRKIFNVGFSIAIGERNLINICEKAESPIEEILFLALAVVCFERDPLSFVVGLEKRDFESFPFFQCSARGTLQAQLPELDGGRVDLLIEIAKHKIVVECDGYEYHKEKESFINDRKRDRTLTRSGYEVMRFSGSEIHENPIGCAFDIWFRIEDAKKRANYIF